MREASIANFKFCSFPECDSRIKDHAWGHIKASDWFFQKNGDSWCPEHIPEWVEGWRARQKVATKTVVVLTCDRCGHEEQYDADEWKPGMGGYALLTIEAHDSEMAIYLCTRCVKGFNTFIGGDTVKRLPKSHG